MNWQRIAAAMALGAGAIVLASVLVGNVFESGGSMSVSGSEPLPPPEPKPAPTTESGKQPEARSGRVEKAIWGPYEMPDGGSAFPVYERLGVDVFQTQLRWADVAPERPVNPLDPNDPTYLWPSDLDVALQRASKHGIEIALLVNATPGWANGGRARIRAPDDVGDFADFLIAASRRYPQIHRWMIWGEPNRADRFLPNRADSPVAPRRYAELLDAAYAALEVASKGNVVIGGMTYTGGEVKPPDFIRWMKLPSGDPPRLDLFGANPYPFRLPDLAAPPRAGGWRDLSDLDTLSAEVTAAYRPTGRAPRLWLSEFTIQSDEDSRYFDYHVSRAEQAEWLRRGYLAAEQAGDVVALGWFTLLDRSTAGGFANWGLMTAGGTPKPAFGAYASIPGGS